MISVDSSPFGTTAGIIIVLLIACAIAGFFIWARSIDRKVVAKRKKMIQVFKKDPAPRINAPILAHGLAWSQNLVLPTTGEPVAWYALIILSRESSVSGIRLSSMGGSGTYVTGVKGFRFFVSSGDFHLNAGGTRYTVAISGLIGMFARGAAKVTSLVAGPVAASGIPAGMLEDEAGVNAAQGALSWGFSFSAPIKSSRSHRGNRAYALAYVDSVTSSVDSRVSTYLTGYNVPAGILAILSQKGITVEEKEEISVIELFIPAGREVYVFGTLVSDNVIGFSDPAAGLSVSYTDPEFP